MTSEYAPRPAVHIADVTRITLSTLALCSKAYNRNNTELVLKARQGKVYMIELAAAAFPSFTLKSEKNDQPNIRVRRESEKGI